MIIEIGTCDFNTESGKKDGIFIEPVKYYFDKLPNCKKENVAISDYDGEIEIFYLTEEDIVRINKNRIESDKLPEWIKGCNSVGKPHPTTLKYIDVENIRKDIVKVVKIKSIIEKYGLNRIEFLKIDTEGHDCIILNNYLDEVDIIPDKIQFENNRLTNKTECIKLVERLLKIGYKIEYLPKDILATYKK